MSCMEMRILNMKSLLYFALTMPLIMNVAYANSSNGQPLDFIFKNYDSDKKKYAPKLKKGLKT